MQTVTKEVFEQFLAAHTAKSEPSTERDGEHAYETWLDFDENEIAFVSYRGGEAVSWHIAE